MLSIVSIRRVNVKLYLKSKNYTVELTPLRRTRSFAAPAPMNKNPVRCGCGRRRGGNSTVPLYL